ncbi:hypothetical protein GCM10010981_30440 [Dyella nitratireducens]|uniref:Uncharacterized protein n=2 Tax=Dyella nitratireducens TaxID=1849580 RepID=A0ABQ1G935_9GAMM|nr:hypothetical protein GCM10010981_30440 [Dyella nitratireducens]GLQ40401.1 hypothetical protein GCM10007902_02500 [Dyella nitratireducens]
MAMKFNPVSIEELSNACMPDKAVPGVYYRQGKDIVLVALNIAEQQDELNPTYICFSGERVEHRRNIPNGLLIPLSKLEPRFHIEGSAEQIKFTAGVAIDYYQEPALVLVDDQPHILLKDFLDEPRGDPRFHKYRLMLNLATREVVRLSPGKMLIVFDHVVMSGHVPHQDKEESEKMAVLKLRHDDRGH